MKNDQPNNILLFTLEYPPHKGGIANYYENIVAHWPQDNIYVLTHKNNNDQTLKRVYYRNLVTNFIFSRWLPAFWYLIRVIKKNKIEHIIVGHVLPLGTVVLFLSKIMKIKYSVILHGMDAAWALKKKRKRRLTQNILKKAQYIICANSYVSKTIKEVLAPENDAKIHVVNPGVTNTPPQIPDSKIKEIRDKHHLHDKFLLFSMGRLVARKGFQQVIKALPRISEDVSNVAYVVAGAGPFEEQLKQEVSKLTSSLRDNIVFLGKITDEEKWEWLEACDAFIMPSLNINGDFEGFGIVYLEANIMGKPVIAGKEGGVKDAVEQNTNGLLTDPRNPTSISWAVIKIATDKQLREKLGTQGRQRAKNDFNWDKQILKIYQIINNQNKK